MADRDLTCTEAHPCRSHRPSQSQLSVQEGTTGESARLLENSTALPGSEVQVMRKLKLCHKTRPLPSTFYSKVLSACTHAHTHTRTPLLLHCPVQLPKSSAHSLFLTFFSYYPPPTSIRLRPIHSPKGSSVQNRHDLEDAALARKSSFLPGRCPHPTLFFSTYPPGHFTGLQV